MSRLLASLENIVRRRKSEEPPMARALQALAKEYQEGFTMQKGGERGNIARLTVHIPSREMGLSSLGEIVAYTSKPRYLTGLPVSKEWGMYFEPNNSFWNGGFNKRWQESGLTEATLLAEREASNREEAKEIVAAIENTFGISVYGPPQIAPAVARKAARVLCYAIKVVALSKV